MSAKYFAVSYDADRSQRIHLLRGKPWTFINLLPIAVNVYVYTPTKTDLIGTIEPRDTLTTDRSHSGMKLMEGYEIHVLYQQGEGCDGEGPQYEIARPQFLFDDSRMVRIGDAVHEAKTNTLTQRTHTDIMGLRIHNHLTIPLDIYYKGNKIGMVAGDDGTEAPMSGSPGSIYLTNDHNGFRIGDELGFVFHYNRTPYCTVKIHDNYMSDLYIGVLNQHYVPTINDMFAYRVDSPNVTGLKYFDQVTGYQTRPTR